MSNVAVILSGCGVFDGAEIHESVLTLLALEQNNVNYQCFAPNIEQLHVINHLTGEPVDNESRNVLVEAARIARGNIKDLADAKADDFDAVILPGGFGAAKNLSDFAIKGADCAINPDVKRFCKEMKTLNKPLGFICIAPAMIPHIFTAPVPIKCTIGTDEETAKAIETMGGKHLNCPVDDIVIDTEHKIISTPAYMLAGNVSEAASGINRLVKEILLMM